LPCLGCRIPSFQQSTEHTAFIHLAQTAPGSPTLRYPRPIWLCCRPLAAPNTPQAAVRTTHPSYLARMKLDEPVTPPSNMLKCGVLAFALS
jgi:hypothetical protein